MLAPCNVCCGRMHSEEAAPVLALGWEPSASPAARGFGVRGGALRGRGHGRFDARGFYMLVWGAGTAVCVGLCVKLGYISWFWAPPEIFLKLRLGLQPQVGRCAP